MKLGAFPPFTPGLSGTIPGDRIDQTAEILLGRVGVALGAFGVSVAEQMLGQPKRAGEAHGNRAGMVTGAMEPPPGRDAGAVSRALEPTFELVIR